MKRFLSLVMVFCLMFSMNAFAAVAGQPSAYQTYINAANSLSLNDSFALGMDMKMVTTTGAETANYSIIGEMAINNADVTNPQMKFDFQMSGDGIGAGVNEAVDSLALDGIALYYKDGFAYMNMMGMNVRVPMPAEEFVENFNTGSTDLDAFAFDESAILYQDITPAADGGQDVTFVVSGEAMTNLPIEDIAGTMGGGMTAGMVDSDVLVKDVTVYSHVDAAGQVKTIRVLFNANTTIDGAVVAVDYDISFNINQIGNVVIDFPDDLDLYIDLSESFSGMTLE